MTLTGPRLPVADKSVEHISSIPCGSPNGEVTFDVAIIKTRNGMRGRLRLTDDVGGAEVLPTKQQLGDIVTAIAAVIARMP